MRIAIIGTATGTRPAGPIRLLTDLRYLGHSIDPVSFYYCFAPDGFRANTVIADVENIPWGSDTPTFSTAAIVWDRCWPTSSTRRSTSPR
jgi:DUF1365 family protein